jgi:RNA recognition motif-containing protein
MTMDQPVNSTVSSPNKSLVDDIETRTVFIRGIPNDASASEIQRQFEVFGDIAIFDERIPPKGIAFVTYVCVVNQ